jgi:DNA-binding transcriptional LysR family regulator
MTSRDRSTDKRIITAANFDAPELLSGPFWGELRFFLAVAKTRSLSQAAQLLYSSQPTVGRAVKRLEDLIGAQLVIPSVKGIALTERGAMLAASLRNIDLELYQISTILQSEKKGLEGVVRVSLSEGISGFFVAPRLLGFSKNHPKIRMELLMLHAAERLRENRFDILVSLNPVEGAEFTVRRAGTIHLIALASHSYIKQYGTPREGDLKGHVFVDSPVYQSPSPIWKSWQDATKRGHIAHTCENSFPYGLMVRSGLGIGLLGNYAMSERALVPLDLNIAIDLPIYIVSMAERLRSRPVKLVFEWLSEVLGPSVPWLADMDDPRLAPTAGLHDTLDLLLPGSFGSED